MLNVEQGFHEGSNVDQVFLLLHGIKLSNAQDPFMQLISGSLSESAAYLALDFSYINTDNPVPSEGLMNEIKDLDTAIKFLLTKGYQQIHIIGKSLGGIVASRWLKDARPNVSVDVAILGYVIGDVETSALRDHLRLVVQGSEDRFGNAEAVEQELRTHGVYGRVVSINGGDHSYRSADGTDVLQQQVGKVIENEYTEK